MNEVWKSGTAEQMTWDFVLRADDDPSFPSFFLFFPLFPGGAHQRPPHPLSLDVIPVAYQIARLFPFGLERGSELN